MTPDKLAIKLIADLGLLRRTRKTTVLWKRQYIQYMLFKKTHMTLTEIGSLFDLDHSTVIHSCKKVQDAIDVNDRGYLDTVDVLREAFDEFDFQDVDRERDNSGKVIQINLSYSEYERAINMAQEEGSSVSLFCKRRVLEDDKTRVKRLIAEKKREIEELEKALEL